MPLTNQPYLPLYVQDWLSNKKLKFCELEAHGLMINIMCYMHKEDDYGVLLLEQKYKQTSSDIENFSLQLAKLLPFDADRIRHALEELLAQNVLHLETDRLTCNRMVRDAKLSEIRALSGQKGGIASTSHNKNFAKAKDKAKAPAKHESENEYENEIELYKYMNIETNISFSNFWEQYDKKVGRKDKIAAKWNKLSKENRAKAIFHIIKYKEAQPDKKYRKNPETYINNEAWNDEVIQGTGKSQYSGGIKPKNFRGSNSNSGGFAVERDG